MKDIIKFPVVLLIVSLLSAVSLAGLYKATLPQKEAMRAKLAEAAMNEVFSDAKSFEKVAGDFSYIKAYDADKKLIGYIAEGYADGYSSKLRVMVGVDVNFVIKGIKVLYQNETPGLGDKVEEIKSSKTWVNAIKGKNQDEQGLRPWFQVQFDNMKTPVKFKKDGGQIDAITGATISSRAVCNAVNNAVEGIKGKVK